MEPACGMSNTSHLGVVYVSSKSLQLMPIRTAFWSQHIVMTNSLLPGMGNRTMQYKSCGPDMRLLLWKLYRITKQLSGTLSLLHVTKVMHNSGLSDVTTVGN